MKLLLVICASALCMVSAYEDYCEMNCKGHPHIACNNDGFYSENCDAKAEVLNLNGELEARFIDLHNELREKVASGKLEGFEPAAQMGSVTWDEELAELAILNVKQCQMKLDKCHPTKNYKYPGQNLAMTANLPALSPKEAIEKAINQWYAEHVNADMSVIDKFYSKGRNGCFTALVNEKNSKLGCAVLRTPYGNMTAYFTACNYARTNILHKSIYKSGKPASGCKTGTHPNYPSLCSSSEKYDV